MFSLFGGIFFLARHMKKCHRNLSPDARARLGSATLAQASPQGGTQTLSWAPPALSSCLWPTQSVTVNTQVENGSAGDLLSERNRDQSLERAVFLPSLLRAVPTLHGPALAGAAGAPYEEWPGLSHARPGRLQAPGRAEPLSEVGALHRCCSSLRSTYTLNWTAGKSTQKQKG